MTEVFLLVENEIKQLNLLKKIKNRVWIKRIAIAKWQGNFQISQVKYSFERGNYNPDKREAVLILRKNTSHSMFYVVCPLYEPTLTWQGGFQTKKFQRRASTRRARRSIAATFDKNKRIFCMWCVARFVSICTI